MVDAPIPNQANYQSTQNFSVDINKIYNEFISDIDKIRSYSSAGSQPTSSIIDIIKSGNLSQLSSVIQTATTLQESRCHAFYRIIGFPVVNQDKARLYNPGLDIVFDSNRKTRLSNKNDIAGSGPDGFRNISIQREGWNSTITTSFSQAQSIDAAVLALSSANIRQFSSSIQVDDPFDTDITNQSYQINLNGLVGTSIVPFSNYSDINGNFPTSLQPKRSHIIRPFMVDPVIDFTVNDSSKLVAIPFVPDKSYLFIKDSNVFVNRPILEKVLRDRFSLINQSSTVGTADAATLNYIKNVISIQDPNIVDQANSGDLYNLSSSAQFTQYINIINSMMAALIQAQKVVHDAQSKYYYAPIPAVNGPEGGCTVPGVFLSEDFPSVSLSTTYDVAIIQATLTFALNQLNAQTANVQGTPDVGGFAFGNFQNSFTPDSSSAFGNSVSQSLQSLNNKRNSTLKNANDALRVIEIIMGEFSGLGLCDIVAVMATLYVMPQNDLLGFLDDDSVTRMNTALGSSVSSPGIQTALTSFTSTIKDVYNLMDKIYQDLYQNNGLS